MDEKLTKRSLDRRSFLKLAGGVVAGAALTACSSPSAPSAAPTKAPEGAKSAAEPTKAAAPAVASGKKFLIKCGVPTNVDYPFHQGYEYFGKKLVEATNGAVEWQSFPNGQLGSNRDLTEGVKLGTIQMTVASSELTQFVPEWDVISLPYLYDSYAQCYKVGDGEVGKFYEQKLDAAGFKLIGFFSGGTRSVFTAKKPVRSLDDLKGLKIRVQQNKVHIAAFNALGAISTPLAYNELYSALQQGVVDGAENDPTAILDMKFNEVCKYYTLTKHFIEGMGRPFVMNKSFFESLPADIQKLVLQFGKEATDLERKYFEEVEGKALADLKSKGMEIIEIDTAPLAKVVREQVFPTIEGKDKQDLIAKILATKA
ncbi:MAG: TRAP transporter substrate-binding protein DctP [Sphingomonadaceae bacterium]